MQSCERVDCHVFPVTERGHRHVGGVFHVRGDERLGHAPYILFRARDQGQVPGGGPGMPSPSLSLLYLSLTTATNVGLLEMHFTKQR